MSENKNNKQPKRWSSTKILDCLSYFSIMFIAVALILRLIFKHTDNQQLSSSFQAIGECLAYVICIWMGFYWTMRKRGAGWNKHNIAWLICYLIAVVVIVVIYIFAVI